MVFCACVDGVAQYSEKDGLVNVELLSQHIHIGCINLIIVFSVTGKWVEGGKERSRHRGDVVTRICYD